MEVDKTKTRTLVYLSLIYSSFFIAVFMPVLQIPLTSITCGLFIQAFGWKKAILIRLSTMGLFHLIKIQLTLFLISLGPIYFLWAMFVTIMSSMLIMSLVNEAVSGRIPL